MYKLTLMSANVIRDNIRDYFRKPQSASHKRYEAVRAFYVDRMPAEKVAQQLGYTLSAVYSITRDFKQAIAENRTDGLFFVENRPGRKPIDATGEVTRIIIELRKKYLSVDDIKALLDAQGHVLSLRYIYEVIRREGFERLPRRDQTARKQTLSTVRLEAPKSIALTFDAEIFSAQNSLGILCVLPYLHTYGLDSLIEQSAYPETSTLNRRSSIMSFLALKLSHMHRYTADDLWCMDRGLGLFAGLNVLPKAAWFSSYSHRVTRSMNLDFLRGMNRIWRNARILSDTANLDFTAIPYWGSDEHLENNWSGKRNKALASILAVLAQDPDTGIITYSDTNVRHDKESKVILEFLDFYRNDGKQDVRYLVFDSKFTTYENLAKLDPDVKFLTIRRRGKNVVQELEALDAKEWKTIRVMGASGKGRSIKVHDSRLNLPSYGKEIRQIAITGHGKIKPALLITNDMEAPCDQLVRKYAKRWLVEKGISEQIEFFHLNHVSSSMVIKVDFDLTMSVLANNLLRLFAADLPGYTHHAAPALYKKFLQNSGTVEIKQDQICISLKKKRNLPAMLTAMEPMAQVPISIWENRTLMAKGESIS